MRVWSHGNCLGNCVRGRKNMPPRGDNAWENKISEASVSPTNIDILNNWRRSIVPRFNCQNKIVKIGIDQLFLIWNCFLCLLKKAPSGLRVRRHRLARVLRARGERGHLRCCYGWRRGAAEWRRVAEKVRESRFVNPKPCHDKPSHKKRWHDWMLLRIAARTYARLIIMNPMTSVRVVIFQDLHITPWETIDRAA